jgi:hypothetical protein
LTERFPLEAPIFYVNPVFPHEILDQNGRVKDDCLRLWNINSNLKNAIGIVLSKLEGTYVSSNIVNTNQNKQVQSEDEAISGEIVKDLSTKSIEELLFIYFNQDDYVYEFTQKARNNNNTLLAEVCELSDSNEKLRAQYEEIKVIIDDYRKQYEQKEAELKEAYSQKQLIDSNFTVEKLIDELRKNIEENYQKPRQKLINEFLAKKIDLDTFKESFKELSTKYHYYSLIKDKLNIFK